MGRGVSFVDDAELQPLRHRRRSFLYTLKLSRFMPMVAITPLVVSTTGRGASSEALAFELVKHTGQPDNRSLLPGSMDALTKEIAQ